jgi:hypothetical protein
MRISFVILIFSLLSWRANLTAQPYYQLLKNDRHWIYTQMISGEEPPVHIALAFALSVQGDTLLQGYSYKKIYQRTLQLNANSTDIQNPKQILNKYLYALMREDTVERKVYLIPFKDTVSMCQPTEHLLYDFSLQVGDTLNDCVLENIYDSSWMSYVPRIDSIRQINYLGLETRAFYTQGIFINYGLLFDSPGVLLEGFGYEYHGLINYGRNGELVFFQYYCEGDSLDCELLSAVHDPREMPQSVISVTPNPARDIVFIQIDAAFHTNNEWQISLLNTMGNVILHENWNTVKELQIDVSNFPDGVYFLNIYGEGINVTKKIIVAH